MSIRTRAFRATSWKSEVVAACSSLDTLRNPQLRLFSHGHPTQVPIHRRTGHPADAATLGERRAGTAQCHGQIGAL
jgi:hypothetical protein